MTESSLVRAILARLKREPRWCGFKLHGSGVGTNGLPDIVGCLAGRFVAIECKTPKGRLTPLQEFRLAGFRDAGALVVVARSVADAEGALGP